MSPEDDRTDSDVTNDTIRDDGSADTELAQPSGDRIEVALPAAGERVGRYELGEVIGRGGMGMVFRARDPELDRPLAIKVVLPATASKRAQQRLLDEARAMAKLRHPAVVPVFDVGATDRGVYIVMPLLGGGTLRSWAEAEPRPWREVLARYVVAGRGLAAAHAAGLVHRDFKPGNVMLGDAGEIMVGDFGLAADADTATPSLDPSNPTPPAHDPTSVAGTPAYMAPEHTAGAPVDARADQFSFCISLWEGLHGERPTQAATRDDASAAAGLPTVPADRRGAPRWLLSAIVRGWSALPERRWPSMTALLDHIERRMRRPRRVAMAAAALAVVGGTAAAVFVVSSAPPADPCPDPRPRLAAVWSPARRAQVEQAFVASGLRSAPAIAAYILPRLDAYAEQWRVASLETCRAAHVTHAESADLFDRKQLCLARRLGRLDALASAFTSSPTRLLVADANKAIGDLPAVEDCSKSEALLAVAPLPTSPERRAAIEQLERELDTIAASQRRGDPKAQLAAAQAALVQARALDYGPILVRALRVALSAELTAGARQDETPRELARVAADLHDDHASAVAQIAMLASFAANARIAEAKALEPVIEAAVTRAGSPPALRWQFEMGAGTVYMRSQAYKVAQERFRKAAAAATDEIQRIEAASSIAKTTLALGNPVEALKLAEQALREMEAIVGPDHPDTGQIVKFIGQIHASTGNYKLAESSSRRALAIDEAVYGADHPALATNLKTLVFALLQTNQLDEARKFAEQAVRCAERSDDPLKLASALDSLASLAANTQGTAAARPHYERALALVEQAIGKDKPTYYAIEMNYADRLVSAKDCATARPFLDHVTGAAEVKPALLASAFMLRGTCAELDRAYDAALADFARVEELCAAKVCEPYAVLGAKARQGELLYGTGRDRRGGLAMLRAARTALAAKGMDSFVADIDKWLAEHQLKP